MNDPWKLLRKELNLAGNVEPEVKLIGLTCPGELGKKGDFFPNATYNPNHYGADPYIEPSYVEAQVAQAASVSSGVEPKDVRRLNRKLIELGHHTPLEAVQFNLYVRGISKACGAQISRHRLQGHVSKSRRFQKANPEFVYPILEKVEDEKTARLVYNLFQNQFADSMDNYEWSRTSLGLSKTEARLLIPIASATERIWWINARAMRDFLKLRLPANAESEIRRLAHMLLDIVYSLTPSLFEDIYEKYGVNNND